MAALLLTSFFALNSCANAASAVPQYVLDYAPLIRITSTDPYYPSDIGAQVTNTHPALNSTTIDAAQYPSPLTLDNLDSLNSVPNSKEGSNVYLASNENFSPSSIPNFFKGVRPDASGKTGDAVSSAVIVNQKPDGTTDAFYMYFYAYNQGNTVVGRELGDHLGDWEHNMIRFVNGKPTAIWYSQHNNGEAFKFNALGLKKQGSRPIGYSAKGSHATYATAGKHDHTIPDLPLPVGPLIDTTDDAGPLWDPLKSAYFYSVTFPAGTAAGDSSSPSFTAANNGVSAGAAPTGYLRFRGNWGDAQLPDQDPRQDEFFGFYKYVGGPTGPRDKQLNRKGVCPDNGNPCIVRSIVPLGG